MTDTKDPAPLDLSALERDYEIVGELGARRAAQRFAATRKEEGGKRRDDDARVLITVVTPPAGDQGNALSHLAADTKLLAGIAHRRLIPVIEGRWIGAEAFAVITQLTTDSSLVEELATGERFSPTRTAAILREVSGVMAWARSQGVVHRHVTIDGVFLEPKTDRVRVSFSVVALPRFQHVDPNEDARTIAKLATAMLTGNAEAEEYEQGSLAALRPDLPERLGEATDALLGDNAAATPMDTGSYLALIGMADPIAAGEMEAARIRDEVLGEQLAEREKLASESAEFERLMVEERAKFVQTMAEEREKFEKMMAKEHEQLAAEKAELERGMKKERAKLVAKRAELEWTVADQLAEMKRVAAHDRQLIDRLRAELKATGERELEKKRQAALSELGDAESALDDASLAMPAFVPALLSPLEELVFDDDSPLERDNASPLDDHSHERATTMPATTPTRKKWAVPVAIAGSAAVILILAVALGSKLRPAPPVGAPLAKAVAAPAPVAAAPVSMVPLPARPLIMDSSAGGVTQPVDSTKARVAGSSKAAVAGSIKAPVAGSINAAVTDSSRAAARAAARKAQTIVREEKVRRDSMSFTDSLFFLPPAPVRGATPAKRDTLRRPDTTIAPPRRD